MSAEIQPPIVVPAPAHLEALRDALRKACLIVTGGRPYDLRQEKLAGRGPGYEVLGGKGESSMRILGEVWITQEKTRAGVVARVWWKKKP